MFKKHLWNRNTNLLFTIQYQQDLKFCGWQNVTWQQFTDMHRSMWLHFIHNANYMIYDSEMLLFYPSVGPSDITSHLWSHISTIGCELCEVIPSFITKAEYSIWHGFNWGNSCWWCCLCACSTTSSHQCGCWREWMNLSIWINGVNKFCYNC